MFRALSLFPFRAAALGLSLLAVTSHSFGAEEPPASQRMAEQVGKWICPVHGGKSEHSYLVYTPPGERVGALPMVIFLHGAGFRGDDVTKLYKDEVPQLIRNGKVFDGIVLCPQSPTFWSGEQAAAFIDQTRTAFAGKFDNRRLYLTGESSGGGGAWEGAKLRAEFLAAVVPIATTLGNPAGAEKLVNLPIWAFHNAHDPYQFASKSRSQILAIHKVGGKYAFYTEYTETPGKQSNGIWPNAHRHAWQTAYGHEPMWDWLFRQRLGEPELSLVPAPAPVIAPEEILSLAERFPEPRKEEDAR